MAVFICHGIIRATDAFLAAGLAPVQVAERLVIVGAGDLAAIASKCPDRLDNGETLEEMIASTDGATALAIAHNRIVNAVAATDDIVPLRLESFHSDEAAIAAMLRADESRLRQMLARIAGRFEFAIRIERRADSPVVPPPPPVVTGRDYLRRRGGQRQSLAEGRMARDAHIDGIEAKFRLFADDIRRLPFVEGGPGKPLARLAALVRRQSFAAFEAQAVALMAQAEGMEITVSGPWAPYCFVADAEKAHAGEA
jgi:predicted regulator of Ras-like GTPase activity (Roadblock/LC7/MglB family)